jgi:hypothetical protein
MTSEKTLSKDIVSYIKKEITLEKKQTTYTKKEKLEFTTFTKLH